ncbi:MAG: iron-sulfur cluster assembly scaffold protein [Vulcanimicrobiota bacterium]
MYSEVLWQHYQDPYNNRKPPDYEGHVRKVNPVCPDVLELFARLDPKWPRVVELYFQAEACPPVIALASLLCTRAPGQEISELARLTQQDLADWVGPLPPNKRHAVSLVHLALQDLVLVLQAIRVYTDK